MACEWHVCLRVSRVDMVVPCVYHLPLRSTRHLEWVRPARIQRRPSPLYVSCALKQLTSVVSHASAHVQKDTHTYTHTHIDAQRETHRQRERHTHTRARAHRQTDRQTHTHTHTHRYTCTHSHNPCAGWWGSSAPGRWKTKRHHRLQPPVQ